MAVGNYITRGANGLKRLAFLVTSAGVADGGKPVATDPATGRLHTSVMPVGVGSNIQYGLATETLSAGKYVSKVNVSGVVKYQLADGSVDGKYADGYVTQTWTVGQTAEVYDEGVNSYLTGLTPAAAYYLSETVAGGVQSTPPDTAGHVYQYLGRANSATELSTNIDQAIYLEA